MAARQAAVGEEGQAEVANPTGPVRRGVGRGGRAPSAGDVEGALKATTILEWLDERHPGRFSVSQLRTLQRRVRDWRALSGPDREVFFEQEHPPGREAQVDFTHCGELGVTVGGEPFGHLLFHFVLSHSGWRYVDVAYGETFAALVKGMQGALWELGGVPEVLRTDNLSAASTS